MSTYLIPEGDCLSLIAERYGVTVDELLKINPQIIDVDLIYAGEILQLPEPNEDFIFLPELPSLCGTPCSKEYVDVIYFPGTGEWWAVTQELLDKYIAED
ncbi:MAG: LysM peptidoglycan-binding domain-containing protein, partial [Candidatus Oceanisphaera merdipullorum]|nr:LysM peptidoglycan-binding domain-containing protein [Candidatus Oceanisphaera merdipullorum]